MNKFTVKVNQDFLADLEKVFADAGVKQTDVDSAIEEMFSQFTAKPSKEKEMPNTERSNKEIEDKLDALLNPKKSHELNKEFDKMLDELLGGKVKITPKKPKAEPVDYVDAMYKDVILEIKNELAKVEDEYAKYKQKKARNSLGKEVAISLGKDLDSLGFVLGIKNDKVVLVDNKSKKVVSVLDFLRF